MILIALFISALVVLGIAIYLSYGPSSEPIKQPRPDGCCGQHEVCEKDSLLAAMQREVQYYDDEELDRFRGTRADAYTEMEIDEFRAVLETMLEGDVPGWVRSLQLRGVEIPESLRDDIILIVGELRSGDLQ